jgi:hypothetical protein
MPVHTQLTSVKLGGSPAWYSQTSGGVEFWGKDNIGLAASMPVILMDPDHGQQRVGLGNPTVNVLLGAFPKQWLSLAGGVLVEVPVGDSDLVDTHWVLLNHVQARVDKEHWNVLLRAGFLKVIGGDDGDSSGHSHSDHAHHGDDGAETSGPIVDPHAGQELRIRFGVGLPVGEWTPSLFTSSVFVVDEGGAGDQFHTLGGSIATILGEHLTGQIEAQVPVVELRRFDWRAGFGLTFHH